MAGGVMATSEHFLCQECSFVLFTPITALDVSCVGLHSDARYPGRMIVALREHYDHLDEVPTELFNRLMADVRECSRVLRSIPDVVRVNVAVLGNQESHVHAHVIPRYVNDPILTKAPWDGAQPHTPLVDSVRDGVVRMLAQRLRV